MINESKYPLTYATDGSAGLDLRILEDVTLVPHKMYKMKTGIRIHIADPNVAGMVLPRSGLGGVGVTLANTLGLIDSDYQGDYSLQLIYTPRAETNANGDILYNTTPKELKAGDRVAQLIFVPVIRPTLVEVKEFGEVTARGEGGFGHSDRKVVPSAAEMEAMCESISNPGPTGPRPEPPPAPPARIINEGFPALLSWPSRA